MVRSAVRALVIAVVLAGATATPATARPSFGEGQPLPGGAVEIADAFSGDAWRPVMIGVIRQGDRNEPGRATVLQQDGHGRWHARFALPAWQNHVIVPLEHGAVAILYDNASPGEVLARTLHADGRLGAPVVVLRDVVTTDVDEDGDITRSWSFEADRRGTVVVAATGRTAAGGNAAVAAVRDPGTAFAPQQTLSPAPGAASCDCAHPGVGQIAADGSVTVRWTTTGPGGASGYAAASRAGRGPFGPAAATAAPADDSLTAASHRDAHRAATVRGAFSTRLRVRPDVLAICAKDEACTTPRVFTWPHGARAILFTTYASTRFFYPHGTWMATRQKDGTFGRPVHVDDGGLGAVFALRTPGRLAIVLGPYLVPFGTGLSDRHAPALKLSRPARTGTRVVTSASCNERCRITAWVTVGHRTTLIRSTGLVRAPATQVELAYDAKRLPKGTALRFRVLARDRAGHRTIRHLTARA